MPAKKIAVWFFKGGVGKTTTSINIAAELARPDGPNKRVALLDFDGQCNLTSMLFPAPEPPDDQEYPDDNNFAPELAPEEPAILWDQPKNVGFDDAQANYGNTLTPNSWSALFPYMTGLVGQAAPALQSIPEYNGNLLVLPGNFRLFDHDDSLASVDLKKPNSVNPLGGFSELCRMLEETYNLDYIIVDMSPGASALAKVVVTSCDYVLPPAAPDFFSLCSAQAMLGSVLPRWLEWHDEVVELQNQLRNGGVPHPEQYLWFKQEQCKVLPFLISNYNIRGRANAIEVDPPIPLSITAADSRWVCALSRLLDEHGGDEIPAAVRQLFQPNGGRMVVPFLKDMGAIFTYSQLMRTPIPMLDMENVRAAGHVGGGIVFEGHVHQLRHAKRKYSSLASFLRWLPPREAIMDPPAAPLEADAPPPPPPGNGWPPGNGRSGDAGGSSGAGTSNGSGGASGGGGGAGAAMAPSRQAAGTAPSPMASCIAGTPAVVGGHNAAPATPGDTPLNQLQYIINTLGMDNPEELRRQSMHTEAAVVEDYLLHLAIADRAATAAMTAPAATPAAVPPTSAAVPVTVPVAAPDAAMAQGGAAHRAADPVATGSALCGINNGRGSDEAGEDGSGLGSGQPKLKRPVLSRLSSQPDQAAADGAVSVASGQTPGLTQAQAAAAGRAPGPGTAVGAAGLAAAQLRITVPLRMADGSTAIHTVPLPPEFVATKREFVAQHIMVPASHPLIYQEYSRWVAAKQRFR